ncbi:hypothetical protein OEA41_003000 [Lepraria neglecta]|uniref:Uncharacterized protein n=1 Tax=Lepraria neglecta TaxID=209136 RepID=A0AAD9Z510_9LECA|nr:hypothetical protein OEA41_003000 [Lepraria neglecta]
MKIKEGSAEKYWRVLNNLYISSSAADVDNDILGGAFDFNFRQQQSHPLSALSKIFINPGLMATYGKRKKRLLSSFSVFHDDKPEPDPNQQRPAYTRLGKAKSLLQRTRSRGRLDDESSDELTSNALLYNVPSPPHQPVRLPSLHSPGAIATDDILRPKSSKNTLEDKPLPPVPPKDPFAEKSRHWKNKQALTAKTTNMKNPATEAKRLTKSTISAPIPIDPLGSATGPSSSSPATSHTTASAPMSTTIDAAELTRKISNLMQQAAAQESETRRRAAIYAAESAKLSPLERGKKAFVKATRAIKDRLSNSSDSSRPRTARRAASSRRSPSPDSDPPPTYETPEEVRRHRLNYRITEGVNLSNPKIRQVTGNGNIPRQPLLVYESMKSRKNRSESSLDDPFSDSKEQESRQSPQDYSGFDFDFSKHKNKGKATHASTPTQPQSDSPSETSNQHRTVPQSTSRFANTISGLAQYSDTTLFSSPPVGHSTPRIRLELQPTANADKSTKGALVRVPSVLEFSFEAPSDDASSSAPSPQPRASDGSSLSVKRKGGTDDLRSGLSPATKKIKTDSIDSSEDMGLATGISQLDTGAERDPLSPKSTNDQIAKPNGNVSKVRRGLSIFNVGKGKAPEEIEDDMPKQFRARPNFSKRASHPRPSSVLFSRGRESRAGMKRLSAVEGDDTDTDELQMNDAAYQVGSKRK